MAEPLEETQSVSTLVDDTDRDITPLIDIFGNRGHRVYRYAAVASDVPERSVRRIAAAAADVLETWTLHWPRPTRLLAHPDPIDVIALLPDQPPVSFTWRGKRRRVRRADGPERVFGEWWKRGSESAAVRDYFTLEDEAGERFWVFRSGDGENLETGSHRWFLHGIFA
ncbi:hypothetical protein C8J33_1091 [Rhizobium sp. PP-CC-3G-465]|nr:hypothetical protein C8J31_1151 [Rhizobium sp. PP-CC-2G-626]TCQ19328.1 hypothetical protein C8J33_1091 [Rhizobium sp. PP-CC-3G-465]